jgi:hypothetical protein
MKAYHNCKIFLAAFSLAIAVSACGGKRPPRPIDTVRVLFIGNSYTSANDLPQMFARLARQRSHEVITDMSAPGGWTLQQHAASPDTLGKIEGQKWDYADLPADKAGFAQRIAARSRLRFRTREYHW